jgi:hypothetical protein
LEIDFNKFKTLQKYADHGFSGIKYAFVLNFISLVKYSGNVTIFKTVSTLSIPGPEGTGNSTDLKIRKKQKTGG